MNIREKSGLQLEILISTMNRTTLEFLDAMFINNSLASYNLLIINQTSRDKLLESNQANIRVVNSFETGLPASRNLAISSAIGDICLIADDDLEYKKDFQQAILNAFTTHKSADIITFQMTDETGKLYVQYPDIVKHDKKTVETANSVVISFKRKTIVEKNVLFNSNFGLGAVFPTANEYVFLRNALKKGLNIFFEPKILLSHPYFSSGKDCGSDKIVYARAALFYKYSGILGYLRLGKYLLSICNSGFLQFNELIPKYVMGLKGINKYKSLLNNGLEKR
jgi:glycosyltransferase involved in cell wall biosynthesis